MKHIATQYLLPMNDIVHMITPSGHALCGDKSAMIGMHKDWSRVTCKGCLGLRERDLATPPPQQPPPEVTKESVKRKPAYEDTDTIGFGKHKGTPLSDVPAPYLHWLWTQRPLKDIRLENYIFNNIEALKKEYPDGIWS